MEIVLRVKSKADQAVQSVRHPINGRMVIGRGPDSAVPLEAPGISRDHLEVQVEDSTLFLTDLSSNGTWINGARMPQGRKCKVREGDFVEVPGYEIQFTLEGAAASAMRPTLPPANVSKRVELAPTPGGPGRSLMASFSGVELFLLLVAVASAALLTLYLTF